MFRRGDDISAETETAIDREVKAILLENRDKARKILNERRDDLDRLAVLLLEKESLGRRDLDEYFGDAAEDDEESRTQAVLEGEDPGVRAS